MPPCVSFSLSHLPTLSLHTCQTNTHYILNIINVHMHARMHAHTHKQAQSIQSTAHSALDIVQCHLGYAFNLSSSACVCRRGETFEYQFVCARNGRYFYVPVSVSVYIQWRGCLVAEVRLVHRTMSLWKLKRSFYVCRGK